MRRVLIPVLILFFMTASFPGMCLAETTSPTAVLTVEQAIELARNNRVDLQAAELDVQSAAISQDLAYDSAGDSLASAQIPGTNTFIDTGSDPYAKVHTANYNLKAAMKSYDTKLEAVRFSVYSKYYGVVTALDTNEAQQLTSQQADEKLKISETRYLLGMDTKSTLYQAQQQAASAQANYAVAQQSLDQKYTALMEYIGLSKSNRPTLVKELVYVPVNIDNPEQKFSDIVSNSPSVWLSRQAVKLTEWTAGNSDSAEQDDINLEKADINVLTTRDSMIQATRNIYYNIKSLEESYTTAEATVLSTKEALRTAKLMLEVGMGTKLDVLNAEIAANSANQTLDNLAYQHAILVMALEKPWAYGAAN